MLLPSDKKNDFFFQADAHILKPLLTRLTSSPDLPILLTGGVPIGSIADVRELHQSGELRRRILGAGAMIDECEVTVNISKVPPLSPYRWYARSLPSGVARRPCKPRAAMSTIRIR
jgi:hypothetical protein